MAKEIVLSGMRPTGELHLGNYFGALKKWVEIQTQYKCFWMIADLHSLITLEDTKNVRKNTHDMAALWMAAGLDPKKSTIFVQSAVPEHGELNSIFATLLPVSMLQLIPTYKEMAQKYATGTFGMLNYPVLQAADILIYKASRVPVGKDQEPHIEITREVARRFNNYLGRMFPEPHALFERTPKILSLEDPSKKMSKSQSIDSYIALLDSAEAIRKKIKNAVTDSGREISYNPKEKPALSNLLDIYALSSDIPIKKLEIKYKNSGYAQFKSDLSEAVIARLEPIQKKYKEISKNPAGIEKILKEGSEKARITAQKTMREVKSKIGLLDF